MRCPNCTADVGSGKNFCGQCGSAAIAVPVNVPVRTFPRAVLPAATALFLLVAGVAWYIAGHGLRASSSGDLLYIPSFGDLGLIEIHPAQPTLRRIARTTGVNNTLVVYNRHRNEFYVGRINGDSVAIVDGESFVQKGQFAGSVGWNTSGLELSPDDDYLVVAGSGAKVLVFDTRSRALARRKNLPFGAFPVYASFSPDGHTLYVSSGDGIDALDSTTLQPREQKRVLGWQPSPIAVSPDGASLFVLQNGSLIRCDTHSLDVTGSTVLPELGIASYGSYLQISRDGGAVWLADKKAIYRVRLSLDGYTAVLPPEPAEAEWEANINSPNQAMANFFMW